jgi:uncharacterized protein
VISGVILFPGAGTNANHQSLLTIENRLKQSRPNINIRRVDFAYRIAGKRFPDRAPVLIETVRNAVLQAAKDWGCATNQIVIGGRSMGGRMCSMAVAETERKLDVAALVCICYPLHPPKQPDKLRTEHLPRINVRTLFISGTRDEFGTVDELENATTKISSAVTHEWIQDARHDLKNRDDEIAELVTHWIMALPS